jgi:hypothetical protein
MEYIFLRCKEGRVVENRDPILIFGFLAPKLNVFCRYTTGRLGGNRDIIFPTDWVIVKCN